MQDKGDWRISNRKKGLLQHTEGLIVTGKIGRQPGKHDKPGLIYDTSSVFAVDKSIHKSEAFSHCAVENPYTGNAHSQPPMQKAYSYGPIPHETVHAPALT